LKCDCGGTLRVFSFITEHKVIRKILRWAILRGVSRNISSLRRSPNADDSRPSGKPKARLPRSASAIAFCARQHFLCLSPAHITKRLSSYPLPSTASS
jgi:hypothetical protein